LTVKPDEGYFAQVQVNESLTFDLADEAEPQSHHYAFHISDAEFDPIFSRVKVKGLLYGSEPYNHTNGQIYTRRGGRGFYFEDPHGHLLEVMTVPETGS
jgi:catechol 2,3-dioxygenase-like lactoylglutathione lyase family enzyme